MSATPGSENTARFRLAEEDRRDPRLARRLQAAKPAELPEPVKASGGEVAKRATFAEACADRAVPFATPGRTVGVIVNRVADGARGVQPRSGSDRRATRRCSWSRAGCGPSTATISTIDSARWCAPAATRDASAPPSIVISTQCIEAGADFDFDAIVTECASLDALRQRFGRLNRLGAIDDARGVVLVRSDALGKDEPDPIYGGALAQTWQWLNKAPRDFGIEAMDAALPEHAELTRCWRPRTGRR